ncbi:MAG: type II toxin-antitoxin system VapC family toxin [Frankiaceae bacterium]|nr:type II toxin-antitoxin system VapC family toxin [Frankiaceae bacterium]
MIYVDTSAAAKLLREEAESRQVRGLFEAGSDLVSSRLLAIELHALAARYRIDPDGVEQVLSRVHQVAMDEEVVTAAIAARGELRSLDAIHLGTMMVLGSILTGVVAYDRRLRNAAAQRSFALVDPAG